MIIFLFSNFTPENRVAVNRVPQYQGQDDDDPPEGEAQGFLLCGSLLKRNAGRNGVRVDGGDKTKISGEEKDDTTNKRKDLTPSFSDS